MGCSPSSIFSKAPTDRNDRRSRIMTHRPSRRALLPSRRALLPSRRALLRHLAVTGALTAASGSAFGAPAVLGDRPAESSESTTAQGFAGTWVLTRISDGQRTREGLHESLTIVSDTDVV